MIENETNAGLTKAFSALGDPTRLAILEHLLVEGEAPAGTLQGLTDVSAPAVSRHLKVLREAGLVTRRIDGAQRIYAARPDTVRAIGHWTMSYRAFWAGSLDRLGAALEEDGE